MKKCVFLLLFLAFETVGQSFIIKSDSINFWNKTDSVQLFGTLSYPVFSKKLPVIVLVSGSGPQDRDETILGKKPFKMIAERLNAEGFAVLRYDDRGGGTNTPLFAASTMDNFVKDASAAIDFLKTRKEINPKEIGMLGHSEGGSVVPMVVSQRKDIAFLVLAAACGVKHLDALIQQNREIYRGLSIDSTHVENYLNYFYRPLCEAIITTSDTVQLYKTGRNGVAKLRALGMTKEQLIRFGITPKEMFFVKNFVSAANGIWFRRFIAHDPTPYLEKLKIPVLAMNGSKDTQVNAEQNLNGIASALQNSGNSRYEIARLPQTNHLFQTAKTGMVSEYAQLGASPNEEFLGILVAWLKKTVK